MSKIPLSWYRHHDVVSLSRDLLGKYLFTNLPFGKKGERKLTGGIIVETEAYAGAIDKASHAHGNRRTKRTEVMFSHGGVAYIYLIYGFHNMFNIITNEEGTPHAILIRAIEPTDGIDIMLRRRNMSAPERKLTGGPGVLCEALGITRELNGEPLDGDKVWLEDRGLSYVKKDIIASPRVGIAYAEEDAHHPWRFRVKDSSWTSPAK
jgi:DNA-3-methyladenine glycosylase